MSGKIIWLCSLALLLMSFEPNEILENKLTKKDSKKLKQAEALFSEGKFLLALPIYKELMKTYQDDNYFKYKAGVCYLYKSDESAKAIPLLEQVEKDEPQFVDVKFYLGRAYHLMYRFDEAIDKFKSFKVKAKPIGEERKLLDLYMAYCENAIELTKKEIDIKIHNLKAPVNKNFSEYRPLITPDESMMIFTYRGKGCTGGRMDPITGKSDPTGEYFEDIMLSKHVDGNWTVPEKMPDNINSKAQDAAIALSIDGQQMFVYKSSKKVKEDIYLSKYDGEDWSHPRPLEGDINTEYWEGSCCLAGDGRTLYFSSDRPGGYGGRDLYIATLQEDGSWGDVQNLGQPINTPYNEDAPFIHPDQITLYFSSDGPESMGGYDIFYTKMENGQWDVPKNVGYPLNTTDDDRYYQVSADGKHGYMSSARTGGLGRHDIYSVEPGAFGGMPILALVIGEVTVDDSPAESRITLTDLATEKIVAVYETNATNGKYTLSIVPGNKYKLIIETDDADPYVEYINVKNLDEYVDVRHEFKIFSEEYKQALAIPDTIVASLQQAIDAAVAEKKLSLLVELPADTTIIQEEHENISSQHKLQDETEAVRENDQSLSYQPSHNTVSETKEDSILSDEKEMTTEKTTERQKQPAENAEEAVQMEKDTAAEQAQADMGKSEDKPLAENEQEKQSHKAENDENGQTAQTKQTAEPLIFKNILFDFDRYYLRQLSKKELDKIYGYMKNHPDATIEIDGHTDWIGTEEYNMLLGEHRAKSARQYLINRGIGEDRLIWRSFGEKEPVAPNALPSGADNPEGRQLNRRCEFIMGGQTQSCLIKMKF